MNTITKNRLFLILLLTGISVCQGKPTHNTTTNTPFNIHRQFGYQPNPFTSQFDYPQSAMDYGYSGGYYGSSYYGGDYNQYNNYNRWDHEHNCHNQRDDRRNYYHHNECFFHRHDYPPAVLYPEDCQPVITTIPTPSSTVTTTTVTKRQTNSDGKTVSVTTTRTQTTVIPASTIIMRRVY